MHEHAACPDWGMQDSPLALLGVLAIVTDVDGASTGDWQHGIQGRHGCLAHNLQRLIVARDQHAHMVWQGYLHEHNQMVRRVPKLTMQIAWSLLLFMKKACHSTLQAVSTVHATSIDRAPLGQETQEQ